MLMGRLNTYDYFKLILNLIIIETFQDLTLL